VGRSRDNDFHSLQEQRPDRLHGPVTEQEIRRIITADQIADNKWRTYEWFGLVIRIDQTKMAKKLFESKPYSTKKVGRAQLR
jgi:hypothetical protein